MTGDPDALAQARSDRATAAWDLLRTLAREAARVAASGAAASFAFEAPGTLRSVPPGDPSAVIDWRPPAGWSLTPHTARDLALVDLYLPICSATPDAPITLGHLGQSLDGFIATHSGDSRFVTGPENLRHMHRLRALCDAVVVGAGTVAADDPQLTTRHVAGPNPLRVVIDPMARLGSAHHVFQDGAAPTLYVYNRRAVEGVVVPPGQAEGLALGDGPSGLDLAGLVTALRGRGCARIFVEGGGVTVSAFLAAGLLDRVQVAVAPMFIGGGRPAFRLPAATLLRECARPAFRVFRTGGDVLFDCDLRADAPPGDDDAITRVV